MRQDRAENGDGAHAADDACRGRAAALARPADSVGPVPRRARSAAGWLPTTRAAPHPEVPKLVRRLSAQWRVVHDDAARQSIAPDHY
jgi:hypothetical protein